jgi:hypothetical protein
MRIRAIVIEGEKGWVEITRTDTGALVGTSEFTPARPQRRAEVQRRVVCEVARDEDREDRYAKAQEVAGLLYGTTRGKPNATNSMVHDVMNEIDRVAGC